MFTRSPFVQDIFISYGDVLQSLPLMINSFGLDSCIFFAEFNVRKTSYESVAKRSRVY